MQMATKWVLWGATALLLGGCAGVSHVPIPDERADRRSQGIRYYRHSLYLLVHSDGMGGLKTVWKFLPDPNKKMSICTYNCVAKLESTFKFDEAGVLTSSMEHPDSSAVPAAVIQAAAAALPAILKFAKGAADDPDAHKVPAPQIFKVVAESSPEIDPATGYTKDQVVFIGDHMKFFGNGAVEPIKVTIVGMPPKNKES